MWGLAFSLPPVFQPGVPIAGQKLGGSLKGRPPGKYWGEGKAGL